MLPALFGAPCALWCSLGSLVLPVLLTFPVLLGLPVLPSAVSRVPAPQLELESPLIRAFGVASVTTLLISVPVFWLFTLALFIPYAGSRCLSPFLVLKFTLY